ncbi:MAG: hypothetical protein DWQ01_02830 [Planctomycetota bacterium]|nr:MAG: hypothetical protein DWQ01_02830 [Planctomycetota bacterium]
MSAGKIQGLIPQFLCLAALTACSTTSWTVEKAATATCMVSEELDPNLAIQLSQWVQEDLELVAGLLSLPVPDRPLEIYCGIPKASGGHLRLQPGESGRHQSHGGHCRVELHYGEGTRLRAILRHELAHHVMEEAGFPEWLNEGLAEYASFQLAASPSATDFHQLLHAGMVVAGWGLPLELVDASGHQHDFRPQLWVPNPENLLAMDYDDYRREVMGRAGEADPEFHAISHLLVRKLMRVQGSEGPEVYLRALEKEKDPFRAYMQACQLDEASLFLNALAEELHRTLHESNCTEASLQAFAWGPCLYGKLSDAQREGASGTVALQAYPSGRRFWLYDWQN